MNKLFSLGLLGISAIIIGACDVTTKTTESKKHSPAIDYNVDMGEQPWAFNIEDATLENENYRSTNWTGKYMQLVFMTLKPGEIIDLELHSGHDQFIRIEQGDAIVYMGLSADELSYRTEVSDDWAIMIPAGYYHKVENSGKTDLKLYTLYAPAEHAKGTINKRYNEITE